MCRLLIVLAMIAALPWMGGVTPSYAKPSAYNLHSQTVYPIGWVRKSPGKTFIEIERRYQPAPMGVEKLKAIWVLYWFDRNDTPGKRSVLQVHPRGNPEKGIHGR